MLGWELAYLGSVVKSVAESPTAIRWRLFKQSLFWLLFLLRTKSWCTGALRRLTMTPAPKRRWFAFSLRTLFVVVTVICVQKFLPPRAVLAQDVSRPTDTKPANASTLLEEIESEWQRRVANSEQVNRADSKSVLGAKIRVLMSILNERFADSASRRNFGRVVAQTKGSEFVLSALNAMLEIAAYEGDRAALVELLSQQCSRMVFYTDIEFFIAFQTKPQIADGFLILCDAFDASQSPAAKKEIAAALRRALAGLNVKSEDDRKMVQLSRRWYLDHKNDYAVDPYYESGPRSSNMLFRKKGTNPNTDGAK